MGCVSEMPTQFGFTGLLGSRYPKNPIAYLSYLMSTGVRVSLNVRLEGILPALFAFPNAAILTLTFEVCYAWAATPVRNAPDMAECDAAGWVLDTMPELREAPLKFEAMA